MTVKYRQSIERKIASALIKAGIAAGYSISVDNGEAVEIKESTDRKAILKVMFQTDEENLLFHKDGKDSFVYLVYGNDGYDVISNYGISLEPLMTEPNRLADFFCERM